MTRRERRELLDERFGPLRLVAREQHVRPTPLPKPKPARKREAA